MATTSGSIYDRWLKRCFPSTEVIVTDSFTNALLAFNQGRADALMWDDTVLVGVAAADRSAKLTNDKFLALPYGIGIEQGNAALKRWVDSRLEHDEEEGHVHADSRNNVAARFVSDFSTEHPAAEQNFGYAPPGAPSGTPFARNRTTSSSTRSGRREAAAPLSRPMILAAYDLWGFVSEYHEELREGLVNTLKVAALGILGAFVIGVVLGAARAHRIPVISPLTVGYVELIRNTPILVQIFMIFYALPQFGIVLDQFTVAWLAVTIWGGAFNTENFRAGFEAVPYRYREAGAALGFGRLATFLNVTLPIGGRIALPSSINTYISVLKNTSLMYVIGYAELTTTSLNISNLTLQTTESLTVLASVYLCLVWGLSALIRLLESRLALPETR